MEDDEQIPLAIVAEGRSAVCERKYGFDEELILYSPSGWINGQIMVKYLEWLAEKMPSKGFALILDVYKSHLTKEFKQKAKELNIELIYVKVSGTGIHQPLDINIFSVFKEKMQEYEKSIIPIT